MHLTWGERSSFDYDGSIQTGTTIRYGNGLVHSQIVTAEQWSALRAAFRSRGNVPIGTSRDTPQHGSIGEWWQETYGTPALMSYMGRILLLEDYAEKNHDGTIRITR